MDRLSDNCIGKTIIGKHNNIKYRTLLSLIYFYGLRIGEVVNLKIEDIDSKRMLILIKAAKAIRFVTPYFLIDC
jgi:integrase